MKWKLVNDKIIQEIKINERKWVAVEANSILKCSLLFQIIGNFITTYHLQPTFFTQYFKTGNIISSFSSVILQYLEIHKCKMLKSKNYSRIHKIIMGIWRIVLNIICNIRAFIGIIIKHSKWTFIISSQHNMIMK